MFSMANKYARLRKLWCQTKWWTTTTTTTAQENRRRRRKINNKKAKQTEKYEKKKKCDFSSIGYIQCIEYIIIHNNASSFKYHRAHSSSSSSIEVSCKRWALLTIQFAFCFMHIYIAACDWLKAQAELNIPFYHPRLILLLIKRGNKNVKTTMKFQNGNWMGKNQIERVRVRVRERKGDTDVASSGKNRW